MNNFSELTYGFTMLKELEPFQLSRGLYEYIKLCNFYLG